MAGACVTLPEYPDAGEPCVNGTDLVLIARCVNGLRVLMWVFATELGELTPAVVDKTYGHLSSDAQWLRNQARLDGAA